MTIWGSGEKKNQILFTGICKRIAQRQRKNMLPETELYSFILFTEVITIKDRILSLKLLKAF